MLPNKSRITFEELGSYGVLMVGWSFPVLIIMKFESTVIRMKQKHLTFSTIIYVPFILLYNYFAVWEDHKQQTGPYSKLKL